MNIKKLFLMALLISFGASLYPDQRSWYPTFGGFVGACVGYKISAVCGTIPVHVLLIVSKQRDRNLFRKESLLLPCVAIGGYAVGLAAGAYKGWQVGRQMGKDLETSVKSR